MAYQVWSYTGEPYLIWNNDDLPEEYTLIPPRSGMIYPVRFDEETETWIESEETTPTLPDEPEEESQPEKPNIDPSFAMLAQANLKIAKQARVVAQQEATINNLNQQIADSYMTLAKQKRIEVDNNEHE